MDSGAYWRILGVRSLQSIYTLISYFPQPPSPPFHSVKQCDKFNFLTQGKGKGKKNARLNVAEKVLQYFKEHEIVAEKPADKKAPIEEKSDNVCKNSLLNLKAFILFNQRSFL